MVKHYQRNSTFPKCDHPINVSLDSDTLKTIDGIAVELFRGHRSPAVRYMAKQYEKLVSK